MMGRIRRRHLVLPLLGRQHLRDSMQVTRPAILRNSTLAGIQSALVVLVALPLVQFSAWSHLIGYAGLGALVALFGRFAPKGRRTWTVFKVAVCQTASVLLMTLASLAGLGMAGMMALLALMGGAFYIIGLKGRFGPPGALIFMFAATAAMPAPASPEEATGRVIMTGAVAMLSVLLCALTEVFRFKGDNECSLPADPVMSARDMGLVAVRVTASAAVAGYVAMWAGMAHPGWASLGAVAVVLGSKLHLSLHRAFQRMAGTVVGSLGVWLLLQAEPNVWIIIAVLALLQILTEVLIGFNYALGQMFVTPMALLMTYQASAGRVGPSIASERVVDTLLGVAIGVLLALLLSTHADRAHFMERHRQGRKPPPSLG